MRPLFLLKIVFAGLILCSTRPCSAQKGIDQKEAEGLYKLGEKAVQQQDYISAYQYFFNAAHAQYIPAYYKLGELYEHGLGAQQNTTEALVWYLKSAESGYAPAQLIMAKALTNGQSTVRDDAQALVWLKKAAENKNAEAQFYYGMAFFSGTLIEKNIDKAIEWVTLSAELNYAEAQHNLGVLYFEGAYVTRDIKQAVKWYTRAAENNFALSQFTLGVFYYEGLYVDQDYALALKWSLKAAEQGHPDAQYNAGIIYYMGYGMPKEVDKGIELFEKAAAQQYKRAVDILASIESERTTILDTAVYRGLKKPLAKNDIERIKKMVRVDCFFIDANVAVNVSMEDLIPFENRIKQEPVSKKSIEDMKKRLPKEPDNYALRYNLGEAYLKQNDPNAAALIFDEAMSILKSNLVKNPNDSTTLYWMGTIHFKRNQFQESVDCFLKYMELNPNDQSAVFFATLALMRLGDSEKIKTLSLSLISRDSSDVNGYIIYEMLTVFGMLNNVEAAMAEAQKKPLDELMNLGFIAEVLKKKPDHFPMRLVYNAFRQMGFLLKVGNKIDAAKEYELSEDEKVDYKGLESFYLEGLTRTDLPSKYVLHKFLSSLYFLGREYDKSITHAREAINIKKTEPTTQYSNPAEVYDVLAATYLMKKDTVTAESVILEKIAQATDEYASAADYLLLAKYMAWRQDIKSTEKYLAKAQELNPGDKQNWIGYAYMYVLSNNYAKARECMVKASMPCDDEEVCKSMEGLIELGAGKYEAAFKAFKKAQIANKRAEIPGNILSDYFK